MKNVLCGAVAGIAHSAIFYLIGYIYFFVLASKGPIATLMGVVLLGSVILIAVCLVATLVAGMVTMKILETFKADHTMANRICGAIIIIAAIAAFFILFFSSVGFWYGLVSALLMFISGVKIALDAR